MILKNIKNLNLIIFFLVLFLGAGLYFKGFYHVKTEKISEKQANKIVEKNIEKRGDQIDPIKLKNEYQENVKKVVEDFLEFKKSQNTKTISRMEKNFLSLKVPKEFKDLHISLLVAINKLKLYTETKKQKDKDDAFAMLDEIQNKYKWLQ